MDIADHEITLEQFHATSGQLQEELRQGEWPVDPHSDRPPTRLLTNQRKTTGIILSL